MIVARMREEERERERESREEAEKKKGERGVCTVCTTWYRNGYFSKDHQTQGRYLERNLPRHVILFSSWSGSASKRRWRRPWLAEREISSTPGDEQLIIMR